MKPHSLQTVIARKKSPAEQFEALGPIAARHGRFPKGMVLPETQVTACPRVKIADLPEGFVPLKWIEALEHNQKIASCCRHPESHEIEAQKSHPNEPVPDRYNFICTCGRVHRRFIVAMTHDVPLPIWKAD